MIQNMACVVITTYNIDRSKYPWWIYTNDHDLHDEDIQRIMISIKAKDIQWIKISITAGNVWHILESSLESWTLMNTSTIKEVAYMKCHQFGRSTYPTMWIEVSRSNTVVHRLITDHWCIPLQTQDHPPIMKMGIKVLERNLTSANKCVEVEKLEESIDRGTLMYSKNYQWWENPPLMTVRLKALKWL